MLAERVSLVTGSLPILIVAPHGFEGDDEKTGLIARFIAEEIDCYAVINNGWERGDDVDCLLDKADCNNVEHCHSNVVKEEFLEPIFRFKNRILNAYENAFVFYIHGMANRHRKLSGDPTLDVVIGFGAGSPNSYTCDSWQKNLMIHLFNKNKLTAYEGSKGGLMSGWARSNMNQLFRKIYHEPRVKSMQFEIIHELRSDEEIAIITGHYLADIFKEFLDHKSFDKEQKNNAY